MNAKDNTTQVLKKIGDGGLKFIYLRSLSMTMTMTGIEAGNLQVRLMMRAMAMVMVMIYFSISSETYLVFMVVAFWLQIAWGGWPEGLSRCSSERVYAGFTYFLCPFLVSSIFVWLHSNAKINGSKCKQQ